MLHKQQTLRIPGDTWEKVEAYKITLGTNSNNAAILDLIRAGINATMEEVPAPTKPDKEPFDISKQYGLNMGTGDNPNPVPEKTSGDAPDNVTPQTTTDKPSLEDIEKRMGIDPEETGL